MASPKMSREEKSFANEVKREREIRSWTQDDLAGRMRAVGLSYVNQTTVSRIENQTRPVRLMEAQALSAIFQRTVASLTNPDGREVMLKFVEMNHRAMRGAYVQFKEGILNTARGQVTAQHELAGLNDLYPGGSDDPDTQAMIDHLKSNLSQFAGMDILGEAKAIYESGRDQAGGISAGIPLLGPNGEWDGWSEDDDG